MDMKVKGIQETVIELRHTADVVQDKARKTMRRVAKKIVDEAKLNVPVDKYNLEQSIRMEVSYGFRGRLQINIVAGGFVNGVNVDQYAMIVHENYEGIGDPTDPSAATKAKMARNPGRVIGSKYLTRAVEAVQPKIPKEILDAIAKEIAK